MGWFRWDRSKKGHIGQMGVGVQASGLINLKIGKNESDKYDESDISEGSDRSDGK